MEVGAEIPTLVDALTKLAGGAFIPVIVALLLEHIRPFQALPSETKKWSVLALFVVLPVAAAALLQFVPAEVWSQLEPFWRALAAGFLGWIGSQAAHQWDRRQATRRG